MEDQVTFTLRRTHIWAIGGLVAGFALGIGTRYLTPRAASAAPDPAPATSAAATPPTLPGQLTPVAVATDGRPFRGKADATVTVVEFTDYQCPFCRQHFSTTYAQLMQQYGDRIKYVVMNYPIPDLHPFALQAAEAAECAREQGKFWPMHDRLFATDALDAGSLTRLAGESGADKGKFNACIQKGAMKTLVQQHIDQAVQLGINGTPVFFVNGRRIEGAVPVTVFSQYIEQALAVPTR
jgi:protein-disulfide isomerase